MEYFDILNDKGIATGEVKERQAVHLNGDWHRSVHCWILSSRFELLLQLRGPYQEANPNKWDTSCAGHISAGETIDSSVVRELKEELGLDITFQSLRHLGTCQGEFREGDVIDREFSEIFLYHSSTKDMNFTLCEREVTAVKWLHWKDLQDKINSSEESYVSHDDEFEMLFAYLAQIDR